jgi:hypothetical protein
MTHEEALKVMMGMGDMMQSDNAPVETKDEMPQIEKDQYIFKVKIGDNLAIFCVRDLKWHESLSIEAKSFRVEESDLYFSGEYQRREILKKAIVWVYDLINEKIKVNNDDTILNQLNQDYVDELWSQYFKYTNIDAKEANLIYTSALKYFKGESQNSYPVLPLIIEVDFMLKGVISMSREEFRTLSSNDLERLQLIMTARADALGLAYQQIAPPKAPEQDGFDSELMNSLPPHLKAAMKYA